jgi:hypothetical protein
LLSNVFMAVRLYPDIPVRIVNILQWLYIGGYGMLNIMNVVCLGARIWRDIRGADCSSIDSGSSIRDRVDWRIDCRRG